MNPITVVFGILAVIIAFIFLALLFSYGRMWINSIAAGAGIGLVNLFMMSLRRVNPSVIVRNRIAAVNKSHIGDASDIENGDRMHPV